jgi:MFS family permease
MGADLQLSEAAYGLGAGIFFIGYVVFEVPSNLILHKVGARFWIARIMVSWGIVSALFSVIETPMQFYILRFLLGVAEAGFAPGVLLYITYWFPAARRARAFSIYLMAIPISGALGAPLSGWIMDSFDGAAGWAGWRWLFLIEALPAIIAGFAAFLLLPNRPADVSWLSDREKRIIESDLAADQVTKTAHLSIRQFMSDKTLWLLCVLFFAIVMGHYTVTFWLSTIIQNAGVSNPLENGLLTSLPFFAAAVTMFVLGRSADRTRKLRMHLVVPMVVGAIALGLSPLFENNLNLSVILLMIAAAGLISSLAMFWAIPPNLLSGIWAAAGIAMINSLGNIAGFVSPALVGWILDQTRSLHAGLYTMAAIVLFGALLVKLLPADSVDR